MKPRKVILSICLIILMLTQSFAVCLAKNGEITIDGVDTSINLESVLDSYNIVWNSPSNNSEGSMPVGGHDVGLNVWVQDNSVYFYIGKSDAMDENNMLAKLGRVKLTLNPNPFGQGKSFKQELKLQDGYVQITGEDENGKPVIVDIWVDINNPVIHVDISGETETTVSAELQSWRYKDRNIAVPEWPFQEVTDYLGCPPNADGTYTRYADTITNSEDGIYFYHKNNNEKLIMNKAIEVQQLDGKIDESTWYDPVTNFVFGGLMYGEGMKQGTETSGTYNGMDYKSWSLVSQKPVKTQSLKIGLHTGKYSEINSWKQDLLNIMKQDTRHDESINWWHDFWNRSYIQINAGLGEDNTGWQVARNYTLFRYMLGCNEYGKLPTKFNGGMFTWDYNGDPDYRLWGGAGMTAQNQRHLYWPMLKSGDFEAMIPQFDFYNNACPNAEQVVKAYWGHEGAMFTEYPTFYGLSTMGGEYLYRGQDPVARKNADGSDLEPGIVGAPATRVQYVHQLDFAAMILEYHRYTGEDISEYVRYIESAARFFLDHYRMRYQQYTETQGTKDEDGYDENGKLVIYPSTAVETYKNVLNPNDVIAGLTAVIEGLIELDEEGYEIDVDTWRDMLDRLPEPTVENDSQYGLVYKPGKHPGEMGLNSPYYKSATYTYSNQEAPQLSVVYPYNLVSQGREGEVIARNTMKTLDANQLNELSWKYTNIIAARLGMTEHAQDITTKKLVNGPFRFPAFWGPGHDWYPDHNWGGTGIMGLQEMALQCYDSVIQPYGAWPEEWNGEFKLHALMDTVVEGRYEDGNLLYTKIMVMDDSSRDKVVFKYPNAQNCNIVDENGQDIQTEYKDEDTISFDVKPGNAYYVVPDLTSPKGVKALRIDENTVKVSWLPVTGAESYELYRYSEGNVSGYELLKSGITEVTFSDNNADIDNKPYYYAVRAIRSQEKGPFSDEQGVKGYVTQAWYQFNDASNPGKDDSENHLNGTVQGNVTVQSRPGENETAVLLNGNGYISVPNNKAIALNESFELEVDVCPAEYGNYLRIVDKYGAAGTEARGFLIDLSNDGRIRLYAPAAISLNWEQVQSQKQLPLNQWSKIKVRFDYDEGKAKLYIDDQLELNIALNGKLEAMDCPLMIGADQSAGSQFKGMIDNLKIQTLLYESGQDESEIPKINQTDKSVLEQTIKKADELLKAETLIRDYEKQAIDSLWAACENAEFVMNNEEAIQTEVNAEVIILSDAIKGLQNAKKDWSTLESLLSAGKKIMYDIKSGKYTEETADAYQNAYDAAKSLKDEATQSEINDAVKALEKAEAELDIVEPATGGEDDRKNPEDTNQDKSSSDKPENNQSGSVQTGDDSKLFTWIMLLIVATAGCSATVYLRKKYDKIL